MAKLLFGGQNAQDLNNEALSLEGIEVIREVLRLYLGQAEKRGPHIVEACNILAKLIELRATFAPR